jgi:hypothetical protein
VPVVGGGKPTLENGVCASWLYNWVKRDHKRSVLLYFAGRPTVDFYTYFGAVPDSVAKQLDRFSKLEPADWFLNRALFVVWSGAASKGERRKDGRRFVRGVEYKVEQALTLLDQWRTLSGSWDSLLRRDLVPKRPTLDQRLLLSVSKAETARELKVLINELAPFVKASWEAMEILAGARDRSDVAAIRKLVLSDPYVSATVKRTIRHNIAALKF